MLTFAKNSHQVFPSLFDEIFNNDHQPTPTHTTAFQPGINISEEPTGFLIEVAAPGRQKADFNIELEKSTITLWANTLSKQQPNEADNVRKYTQKQFGHLNFKRRYRLPKNINQDGITANFDNGVLYVWLPKTEDKPLENKRSIDIK